MACRSFKLFLSVAACVCGALGGCAPRPAQEPSPASLTETRDPTASERQARGTGVEVRLWVVSPAMADVAAQATAIEAIEVPRGPRLGASAILPESAGTAGGTGTAVVPSGGDAGPAADDGATNRPFANAPRPPASPKRLGSLRPRALADAQATLEGLAREFDQSALDPALVEAWARNGMRVVRVPADRLPIVRQRLGLIAPEAQQLIGFSSRRVSVARGPGFSQSEAIELDSGVLTLESGHLRLLLRSWPVPKEAPGARARTAPAAAGASLASAMVRVEVTPQAVREAVGRVVPPEAEGNPIAGLSPAQSVANEDAGSMFARLAFEASLDAGDALVVFAIEREAGGASASDAGADDASEQSQDTLATSERVDARLPAIEPPAPTIVRRGEVGPAVPDLPTLGDALLTDALAPTPRGDRIVLVLVANPPATYTLLK